MWRPVSLVTFLAATFVRSTNVAAGCYVCTFYKCGGPGRLGCYVCPFGKCGGWLLRLYVLQMWRPRLMQRRWRCSSGCASWLLRLPIRQMWRLAATSVRSTDVAASVDATPAGGVPVGVRLGCYVCPFGKCGGWLLRLYVLQMWRPRLMQRPLEVFQWVCVLVRCRVAGLFPVPRAASFFCTGKGTCFQAR
jgi:hypothetical protein